MGFPTANTKFNCRSRYARGIKSNLLSILREIIRPVETGGQRILGGKDFLGELWMFFYAGKSIRKFT